MKDYITARERLSDIKKINLFTDILYSFLGFLAIYLILIQLDKAI